MLPSIVGPPLKGVADFKAPEANAKAENSRDEKRAGSDSFGDMIRAKDRNEKVPMRERVPLKADKTERVDRADRSERTEKPERRESDDKVEKVTATRDNGVQKKSKGNSDREDAILKFMDSFESEFGVPPTKIVEAMANLKASDQADSPEQTADQVIGQLDLDDQQEDQAKSMYMGLLAQLAQMNTQPQQAMPLPKPEGEQAERMFGGGTATMATAQNRFTSAQDKRDALNQSLDSMNQKFWMKGGTAAHASVETPLSDKLAQMSLQEKMMQPQGLQIDESLMNQRVQQPIAGLQNPAAENLTEASDGEASPEVALAALVAAARAAKGRAEMKDLASEFEDSSGVEAGPQPNLEAGNGKMPMKADAMTIDGASQGQAKGFEFGKNAQQNMQGQGQGQPNTTTTAKGEIQAKTKSADKADFKQTLGIEGLHAQPTPLKQDALAGGAAVAGAQAAPAPTKAENEANIRQIMNQAQYLIKRGGGEMKVEMTPEGLGKINMKVLVQDGKVNVQMAADTQEAKKTLESGLSELKNSLAAHKLSMDHVKIDVVSGTNTDNNAQNQMNQNNHGSRDQSRQFWNNFSENFGSGNQDRSGFADIPSLRGYPRPRSDKGIEPVETASVNKYAAAGKGKGLNLVA